MEKRCLRAEPSPPFPSFGREGGRTGGTAGSEPLAPAGARRPAPCGGPPPGQRIPGRRARCPLVTPGPRCAGVNDRRRRSAAGAARSAGGPGRPLSRHHIALSPSNTPRAPRLAGPRPRPHAPASGLGAGPGLRVRPSVPSLCAPRARADEPQSGLAWPGARRAPAPLAEPRCRRGGSVVVPVPSPPPPSVHTRGEVGERHEEVRARGWSALPHPRPGRS